MSRALRVYTYCSYKGSYNGYQYAFWDTADSRNKEYVESVLSKEGTEAWPSEFSYVKSMLEHSKGWKILLKKGRESEGFLLVSKIEKAESQFFINVAFVGKWNQVKEFAAHCIWDLMDRESQGLDLMHDMERILKKSPDREKYYLKMEEYRRFEEKVQNSVHRMKEELAANDSGEENPPGFKEFVFQRIGLQKIIPYVRLDKEEDRALGLRNRRKKVQNQVIGKLLRKTEFSQEYVLMVTDEGELEQTGFGELWKAGKANMIFDVGYIRR